MLRQRMTDFCYVAEVSVTGSKRQMLSLSRLRCSNHEPRRLVSPSRDESTTSIIQQQQPETKAQANGASVVMIFLVRRLLLFRARPLVAAAIAEQDGCRLFGVAAAKNASRS
ncbi:hypothetical protein J3459_007988 [Metarhizium acridum]|nr:hypothetical protein J3459_007988 [Metarhizium acridum]